MKKGLKACLLILFSASFLLSGCNSKKAAYFNEDFKKEENPIPFTEITFDKYAADVVDAYDPELLYYDEENTADHYYYFLIRIKDQTYAGASGELVFLVDQETQILQDIEFEAAFDSAEEAENWKKDLISAYDKVFTYYSKEGIGLYDEGDYVIYVMDNEEENKVYVDFRQVITDEIKITN